MAAASGQNPPQIPSDSTEFAVRTISGAPSDPQNRTLTEVHVIKKVTKGGTDGSMTFVKGVMTAYTPPT